MRARRALVLAYAGAAVALAAHCSRLTELLVLVDSDLDAARIDTIAITVDGPSGFHVERSARLPDAGLPVSLELQAGSDDTATITVRVAALNGGAEVVGSTVRARFVLGESRVIPIALCASCAGAACAQGKRCDQGACVAEDVPSSSLPPFGSVQHVSCAPSGASDAGDAGKEGGAADAGPDAPGCPGAIDVGDGGTFDASSCGGDLVTCQDGGRAAAVRFRPGTSASGLGYSVRQLGPEPLFGGRLDDTCAASPACVATNPVLPLPIGFDIADGRTFALGTVPCGPFRFSVTAK